MRIPLPIHYLSSDAMTCQQVVKRIASNKKSHKKWVNFFAVVLQQKHKQAECSVADKDTSEHLEMQDGRVSSRVERLAIEQNKTSVEYLKRYIAKYIMEMAKYKEDRRNK